MTDFIVTPDTSLLEKYVKFTRTGNHKILTVDWEIGNTCNFRCSYCKESSWGGSNPWPDVDTAIELVKKIVNHYGRVPGGQGKYILWNILGGEPTVWKDFEKFFKALKETDPTSHVRMQTNGSRSLAWWKRNAQYVDDVLISYHPEQADYKHISKVSKIVTKDNSKICSVSVCLYPPLMDTCKKAAEYFWHFGWFNSISIKTLQKTLGDYETYSYNESDLRAFDAVAKNFTPSKLVLNYLDSMPKEELLLPNPSRKFMFGIGFVDENGAFKRFELDELMGYGLNTWKGWDCYIGLDSLAIHAEGNVRPGSNCDRNNICGNWLRDGVESIVFPDKPVLCRWDFCACGSDIGTTKVKRND